MMVDVHVNKGIMIMVLPKNAKNVKFNVFNAKIHNLIVNNVKDKIEKVKAKIVYVKMDIFILLL